MGKPAASGTTSSSKNSLGRVSRSSTDIPLIERSTEENPAHKG
jgi:hypothetical protein